MKKYLILMSFIFIFGCSNVDKNLNLENEKNILLLKGVNSYSNGEKQRALNYYNKVLKLDSKNILALRESGIIYSQFGKERKAKERFEKVLEIDKSEGLSLKYLSYLEFENKNYLKCIEYLDRIPDSILTEKEIILKGYSYYLLEKYSKSLENYSKVNLRNILENEDVTRSYIEVLNKSYKKEKVYQKLLDLSNVENFNYKSTLIVADNFIENFKDYSQAEKVLKLYLNKNPLEKNILLKLIEIYYLQGKNNEAEKLLELITENFE